MGGGEAVGDIDADQTVGDRPQHEVIVERAVVAALVTGDKAAAVHEDKYRTRRVVCTLRGENVQQMPRVVAVGLVADDMDVSIGFARMQRRIQRARLGGFNDCADLPQAGSDSGGNLCGQARWVHDNLRWKKSGRILRVLAFAQPARRKPVNA